MSSHLSRLEPGARLSVMPPLGSFVSQSHGQPGRRYTAFAAGCGITPVLALVRTKLAEEPDCSWTVIYGNRSAGRAMFLDELLGLKDRYVGRLALHFVMSREPSEAEWLVRETPGICSQHWAVLKLRPAPAIMSSPPCSVIWTAPPPAP